jgi:arginase
MFWKLARAEAAMGFVILEAPSILGLKPSGVERLPEALLAAGLGDRLGARVAGRVSPSIPYNGVRDPETLVLNVPALVEFSPRLADAVESILEQVDIPIVLGGDCSILLGTALALRRRGRFGLLFIDGHADFYQPEAEPDGEAASMDLALATGRGPDLLTNLEGRQPLVRDEDVVLLGYRDAEEQATHGSQPLPNDLLAFDLASVRREGAEATAQAAIQHLTRPDGPAEGFWVHVDADVLGDDIMPAVDYRLPDGLSWDEFSTVHRIALQSGRAVGLELTVYNPALDPDGSGARGLANAIAQAAKWPGR